MPAIVQGLFIKVKGTLITMLTYQLFDVALNTCCMKIQIFLGNICNSKNDRTFLIQTQKTNTLCLTSKSYIIKIIAEINKY